MSDTQMIPFIYLCFILKRNKTRENIQIYSACKIFFFSLNSAKMVRAWYMDESTAEDRNEPHMLNPPKFVDVKYLEKLGILYFQVSHANQE